MKLILEIEVSADGVTTIEEQIALLEEIIEVGAESLYADYELFDIYPEDEDE